MSPQVVDFNADGHPDILAGTYDGSPHIAYGSAKGFAQPIHILNGEGKRILHNQYYADNKWIYSDKKDPGHYTSAYAFDWDGDGDFDLLLGDFKGGRVYLVLNAGSNGQPRFAAKEIPVKADGKPIRFPKKLATLRMVDWNGDNRPDLLCGLMGDPYRVAKGGALWVHLDRNRAGAPDFGKGKLVVKAEAAAKGRFAGPGAGFYFDAVDIDGDGDLDLLVGGKATKLAQSRQLNAQEKARLQEVSERITANTRAKSAIYGEVRKAAGNRKDTDYRKRYTAGMAKQKKRLDPLLKEYGELRAELEVLAPSNQLKNLVWLYINKGR